MEVTLNKSIGMYNLEKGVMKSISIHIKYNIIIS